jgi:prophage regulatory protein
MFGASPVHDERTIMPTPERLLRLPEVRALTALSRSSIYAYMAAGAFPTAINIGARSIAWIESDIAEWIDARIGAHRKLHRNELAVSRAK